MGEKLPKKKEETDDDDDGFTCSKCGTVYENTANIRSLANRLTRAGKPFKCPECLYEEEAERKEAEEAEEEAAEESEEESEPEEEEAPPAAAPKKPARK